MNFEYVDKLFAEGFKNDVEYLKKELPVLTASMELLSKAGKDVYDKLGGTKNLKDMVETTAKAADVNTKTTATVKALNEETLKLNMAIKAQNDALRLKVQIQDAAEGSIAKELLIVKQLTKEYNSLNQTTQKARAEQLKAEINSKNDWIKANSDALSAQKINIGNYPEMMAQMTTLRRELDEMAKAGLQNTQVYADMEDKLTEISSAMGPTSAQLNTLTNSMTALAQAGKQDTQEFKDLQQQAMALKVNITTVKQAIAGTTDAATKNAAAMNSSGRATFAVSQVLRELPSFAYSTSTGILSLSNNIPMLGDAIKDLKEKNEAAVASGQKAIPVWKSLGLAIFGVNGLITLGVSAITILAARMAMADNETKKAASSLDEYNNQMERFIENSNTVAASIAADAKFDISKAHSQVQIMQDQTKTLSQRFLAYKQLQSIAPDILDNLDQEGFKTAEGTKRMQQQLATMDKYLLLQTAINKGRSVQKQNIDLQAKNDLEIKKQEAVVEAARAKLANIKQSDIDRMKQGKDVFPDVQFKATEEFNKQQGILNKLLEDKQKLLNSEVGYDRELSKLESQRAALQGKTRESKKKEHQVDLDIDREYYHRMQSREQYDAEREAKFQERLNITKDIEMDMQNQRTSALNVLNKQYQDGLLSYEVYTKGKEDLDRRFVKTSLLAHLAFYEEMLKVYPGNDQILALISKANSDLANLYAQDAKNYEDEQRKKREAQKKVHDDMKQLVRDAVSQAIDTNQAIVDAYYQKQIEYQQQLLDGIKARRDAEIDAINETMQSDEKKQIQIRALNAQTAQQEKQIQAEMRRMKREQAIADRVAATLRVVENTAAGITRASHDYKWPYSLIPMGVIGAIGAAQIAAIYAQPLPQYGQGTPEDAVGHPGGPAVIGDKPEYVFEPGKRPYFTDRTHVRNLPRHTRVIPEAQMVAGGMGFMTPQLLAGIVTPQNGNLDELRADLRETADRITSAIRNKPETQFIASNGEFKKVVKRGNSYYTYLSDNF